jgi:hypothetical protein
MEVFPCMLLKIIAGIAILLFIGLCVNYGYTGDRDKYF